jgi:hypothetical protein
MTSPANSNDQDASHPNAKQAAVIDDGLFPMPRAQMAARDILDQAGAPKDVVLQRDYNDPIDHVFSDNDMVDLREGNVFKTRPRCGPVPCRDSNAKAKMAFIADDAWAVTITARQTGHSLKRLLGLPDDADLFRDFDSPNDERIANDVEVVFRDGPVFTVKSVSLTIKVNKKPVTVTKRQLTGLEIKQAAIDQGVNIKISFVLYEMKKDGDMGPAIPDDKRITVHDCDEFRCVAPDDNS